MFSFSSFKFHHIVNHQVRSIHHQVPVSAPTWVAKVRNKRIIKAHVKAADYYTSYLYLDLVPENSNVMNLIPGYPLIVGRAFISKMSLIRLHIIFMFVTHFKFIRYIRD